MDFGIEPLQNPISTYQTAEPTMHKTLITIALLAAGCATQKYYDDQWSKAGATEADWKRDSHECEVEQHQRSTYDDVQHQNAITQQRQFGGPRDWTAAPYKVDNMPYWETCMQGRSWTSTTTQLGDSATRSTRTFKP
jgi:hypothetical protein